MGLKEETTEKMQKHVDHFQQELRGMRSNRAHAGMVDRIIVEVYGSQMPVRDVASISIPEARQILLTPFDPQAAGAIAKGIEKSNCGLQPVVEGGGIRIVVPPMDSDTRKDVCKIAKRKAEDAKVGVRDVRQKAKDFLRKEKSGGNLTEDEERREEKMVQELTDKYCKQIDEFFTVKEKELMEI